MGGGRRPFIFYVRVVCAPSPQTQISLSHPASWVLEVRGKIPEFASPGYVQPGLLSWVFKVRRCVEREWGLSLIERRSWWELTSC